MARFDVFEYATAGRKSMLVLDIQADLHSYLPSRVVVPLVPLRDEAKAAIPRLKPIVTVNGKQYILATTDMAAISAATLGKVKANIEDQRHDIVEAIDFLMQGF